MPIDEFIIKIYLMVDDYYKKIDDNQIILVRLGSHGELF